MIECIPLAVLHVATPGHAGGKFPRPVQKRGRFLNPISGVGNNIIQLFGSRNKSKRTGYFFLLRSFGMDIIKQFEEKMLRTDIPDFNAGDTVQVHVKVKEGNKQRIQVFQGLVIGRSNGSNRETFTVRKIAEGVGVERIFPLHSPIIDKIKVVRRGRVRRAKLYYIREKIGKSARIREKRTY